MRSPRERRQAVARVLWALPDLEAHITDAGPDANPEAVALVGRVHRALRRVEGCRRFELLDMLYREGLTLEQAAERLGLSYQSTCEARNAILDRLGAIILGEFDL